MSKAKNLTIPIRSRRAVLAGVASAAAIPIAAATTPLAALAAGAAVDPIFAVLDAFYRADAEYMAWEGSEEGLEMSWVRYNPRLITWSSKPARRRSPDLLRSPLGFASDMSGCTRTAVFCWMEATAQLLPQSTKQLRRLRGCRHERHRFSERKWRNRQRIAGHARRLRR
jgi:hypothetical protein